MYGSFYGPNRMFKNQIAETSVLKKESLEHMLLLT